MKLMTKELAKTIPAIGAQDGKGEDAVVYAKFFNPIGSGTWFILEFDGEDEMFGWADLGDPDMAELGYLSLSELQGIRLRLGLGVERDLYFEPKTLRQAKEELLTQRGF